MKAYSEDLRQKIVQGLELRGMSKPYTARLFHRYTRLADREETPGSGRVQPRLALLARLVVQTAESTLVQASGV